MNPFTGLGVAAVAFVVVLALGYVPKVSTLVLVASIAIVAVCVVTLVASARRRHRDRLAAYGRMIPAPRRPAPPAPESDPYEPAAGPWRPQ